MLSIVTKVLSLAPSPPFLPARSGSYIKLTQDYLSRVNHGRFTDIFRYTKLPSVVHFHSQSESANSHSSYLHPYEPPPNLASQAQERKTMSAPFFRLPSELRNSIYELVLLSRDPINPFAWRWNHEHLNTELLCVNRTIHSEASPLFYG